MSFQEEDSRAAAAFRIASLVSIFVILTCGFLFCLVAEDVERFGSSYRVESVELEVG